ncbi:unnamed protein product [Phytophthora lilii]|uniref:Unnamed protein product n=1 Tax=Phytophthora lilii TaxID=2077276 RepID=A0A9W6TFE8_9STRA|nr:unnamed protein product [Phytophthora lilii]
MEFKNLASSTKKAPFANPYPPIVLSTKEKKQLRQLAKTLVEVNVDGYEEFLYDNNGKLPESEWKFFRRDEQVETYLRRREKYNLRVLSEELSSLDVADIRSIGSRDGTIEDAVYGAMGPTTETMRYKSVYIQDGIEDCNVLVIIDNVTQEEPFTSLSIRWRVTENPPILRSILKSYDHIYLEATGFTHLSNGERVAFHLLHSVDFPSATPPLPDYSRGQVAAIGFWRQTAPNVVEIHGRGVFTLPFERARALFVPVVTTSMSKSVMHIFNAAHMKKLRWALTERRTQALPRSQSCADRVCSVCNKKRTIHKGDSCDLCGELVCSVCRISHKVASVELDNKMHWTKVHVCPFCMTKVVNSDTTAVVRAEIEAGCRHFLPRRCVHVYLSSSSDLQHQEAIHSSGDEEGGVLSASCHGLTRVESHVTSAAAKGTMLGIGSLRGLSRWEGTKQHVKHVRPDASCSCLHVTVSAAFNLRLHIVPRRIAHHEIGAFLPNSYRYNGDQGHSPPALEGSVHVSVLADGAE